jgi:hypothetical protein
LTCTISSLIFLLLYRLLSFILNISTAAGVFLALFFLANLWNPDVFLWALMSINICLLVSFLLTNHSFMDDTHRVLNYHIFVKNKVHIPNLWNPLQTVLVYNNTYIASLWAYGKANNMLSQFTTHVTMSHWSW